ncbi:helix-turn-helix domain-containing protein [Paenibacillus sp. Soil787]|uniref:response regulator transcription factor n=1 Tax=Paenibacillus sp. Soil787 TaxID=1736411 RepID=UPI000700E5E8|nr:helix-turn-helix domain-containing protein [Paenibacillus sp. Soil787]KRF42269.1 hypothetical protein ASG93_21485 [Paenibacillus sp. Soil787]
MFKVFFVDDEELVVKSLQASLDWKEYGFELAGYALNGEEAFDQIRFIQPDVVITDIRMPGTSGLELIKRLKNASNRALFIVVSGYAEFALAQKAIKYGAFGYCLKPFDEEEIIGYLKKAKGLLEENINASEMRYLDLIEDDSEEARAELNDALNAVGINADSGERKHIVVSVGKDKLNFEPLGNCITLKIGYNKFVYVIQTGDESRLWYVLKDSPADLRGFGVSNPFVRVEELKNAIHAAELRAYHFFTSGKGYDCTREAAISNIEEHTLKQIKEVIVKQDIQGIAQSLDEMGSLFGSGLLNIKHALIVYNAIMSFSGESEAEHMEKYVLSYDKLAGLFSTAQEMLLYLKGVLSIGHDPQQDPPLHGGKNRTFNLIFQHINANFRGSVSIQNIAKEFNVNANYVSQLFKKEVGTTFTEYVSKLRIEYACKLIASTDMSINEIAEKAGYDDYFYFSRIFKRLMGTSPSNYRKHV